MKPLRIVLRDLIEWSTVKQSGRNFPGIAEILVGRIQLVPAIDQEPETGIRD